MTTVLHSSPWTITPAAPFASLRDIMDETAVQANNDKLTSAAVGAALWSNAASAPRYPTDAPDTRSDYAMALALQQEEQMSTYTIDYTRLAPAFDDSNNASDGEVQLTKHRGPLVRHRPPAITVESAEDRTPSLRTASQTNKRRVDHRKIRTKPVRHVVVVSIDKADDDWLEGGTLYELFFSAVDSFHDIAHEFAFNGNDSY
ncbi:hypothetical protein H257_13078 [Aphanomyces astaci]|uniref:Uncharacterized protein n=2 Tax=Aphanomyces astaci TaxID=112090 RepID=W4FVV9_APHAT|nr:hypothetical protein H257_13078 [Aphanomyces astaci]ETV71617.1 hypothetical protein H257_13078 [Aphanomyces astaci]|eukprot:XP_009838805.1 hypothetical protein H257_13078 [Aphanomyces astaci]